MKFWYHLVAALVGLATSALIVYAVFGSASEEGARQEGSAGALSAEGARLCGTIPPAQTSSQRARRLAAENLPALFDQLGPIPAIADDQPDQKAWVARVHAAGGLCLDEIRIEPAGTTIAMSTIEGVEEARASAYAAGALAQAFTPPFSPPRVTLRATVGGTERVAVVSQRAWRAFGFHRQARGAPLTMQALAAFRRETSFGPGDLRVNGWR